MSFIKTIRAWLQKPWFVGVLALVALAYVGRNIVLPIVRMTSGGSYAQSQSEPTPQADTDSTPTGAGLVAGVLSAIGESTFGAAPPKDFRRLRDTMLGDVSDTFARNPFLAANDPRQPNARHPGLGSITDPSFVDDRGDEAEAPPAPLIAADLGLQLSAILRGPSGNLALINRRVMGVGDEIDVQLPEESGLKRLFGPSTRDRTLRVEAIHATEVHLSGRLGRFRLELEDAVQNP